MKNKRSEESVHLDASKYHGSSSGSKSNVFPKGCIFSSLSGVSAHLSDQGAGNTCNA
jgi:hypothetical protein